MQVRVGLQVLVCFLWLFAAQAYAAPTATQQVSGTVDAILGVLRDEALGVDAKKDKIRALIAQRFDFRAMSQRTLAQNWRKASDAEKDRFVELYTRLLENTYFVMVEEYTNEAVEYRSEKIRKEKYAQVETAIVASDKEIPVIYRTRLKNGEWWIYDVVVEGVSLISNYRSSYQQIAKREGISGLLAKMEAKTACNDC